MVTSCHRRMGNYVQAAQLYEKIHEQFPKNIECLRYLVAICRDMDTPYEKYQIALSKLERANIQQTMVAGAGRTFAQFGGEPARGMGNPRAQAARGAAPAPRFSSFAEGESSVDESMGEVSMGEVSLDLSESGAPSPARSNVAGAGAAAGAAAGGGGGGGVSAGGVSAGGGGGGGAGGAVAKKSPPKKKQVDSDDDWGVSDDDELPGFGSDN